MKHTKSRKFIGKSNTVTKEIQERGAVAFEDSWDLTALYCDIQAWEQSFQELETEISQISSFQGKLGDSVATLGQATALLLQTSRKLEKVYTYAHLLSDVDTANAAHLGHLERARNLSTRFSTFSSYFTPELLALEPERLKQFLANPNLAEYRRYLVDIVRYLPFTLSANEENLLAMGLEVFGVCGNIFSQLNNADLRFGSIIVDGEKQPLSHGTFIVFEQSYDREVRRKAFFQYYQVFNEHKHSIAATLAGAVKRDVYLAKARKFPSALHHSLFADNVTPSVYETLIQTVNAHLEALHRYYGLRKRLLQIKELQIYDTYVPLMSAVNIRHSYQEACDILREALSPLGEEYIATLHGGLAKERWVDRYENKGKRSGAYSSGCYDSYPYILMNYKEEVIGDLFTLAHEAGHSMHSYYSCRHQPYQDHGYTIFVAEIASTFNEQLLWTYLKHKFSQNKKILAFLINHEIDSIKATLYRQTMFAEFEKQIHDLAENDEPLTVAVFQKIYGQLLKKYFGPEVVITELSSLECLRIPHFYSPFYVYKYATGVSAAISLAKQVLKGGDEERRRYHRFLQGGCSKYPLELLRDAGVDLASPEPIEAGLRYFAELVGELEVSVS